MAWQHTRWAIQVTFRDRGDNQTTKTIETSYDSSALVADVLTTAQTLINAMNLISSADIISYSVISNFFQDDPQPLAGLGEIENTALITFSIAGIPNKRATFSLPAPVDGVFAGSVGENYNIVDLTDTDFAAFTALFTAPAAVLRISDGEKADLAVNGRRVHRQSSRGRTRRIG